MTPIGRTQLPTSSSQGFANGGVSSPLSIRFPQRVPNGTSAAAAHAARLDLPQPSLTGVFSQRNGQVRQYRGIFKGYASKQLSVHRLGTGAGPLRQHVSRRGLAICSQSEEICKHESLSELRFTQLVFVQPNHLSSGLSLGPDAGLPGASSANWKAYQRASNGTMPIPNSSWPGSPAAQQGMHTSIAQTSRPWETGAAPPPAMPSFPALSQVRASLPVQ